MTSTPVNGMVNMQQANLSNQTRNTLKTDTSDFGSFLKQSTASLDTDKTTVKSEPKKTDTGVNDTENEDTDVTQKAGAAEKTDKPEKTTSDDDSPMEKVTDVKKAVEKVADTIKKELDVDDEAIMDALNELGLNMVALLDTGKIPEIVADIQGTDQLSIVTDETLYDQLSTITDQAAASLEEVSDTLGMTAEELTEAVKDAEVSTVIPEELSFENILSEENGKTVQTSVEEKPLTFEEKITVVDRRTETKTEDPLNSVQDRAGETKEEVTAVTEFKKSENFEGSSQNENSQMSFAQNILTKAAEELSETSETAGFTTVNAEDVINQITESIKVDISADTKEISLKLHPESLGTVNVKVAANAEGAVTAQFTAQNESVKAVIESQATVLKEALQEKGVTVEAVEVTVQSHEFERNLSDQNREQNNNRGGSQKRTRHITLDDDITELSGEDELVREMMVQNGNTVDYIA